LPKYHIHSGPVFETDRQLAMETAQLVLSQFKDF